MMVIMVVMGKQETSAGGVGIGGSGGLHNIRRRWRRWDITRQHPTSGRHGATNTTKVIIIRCDVTNTNTNDIIRSDITTTNTIVVVLVIIRCDVISA
ncbi:hypothetical protein Pcinc_033282 [Petrolisthes cinctipes]|uniref:Uncharacterized protein n=1 Tax=Petrolisthes cinctipes TaxID=88211 RepID=A0AAE1ESL3_PETCI|nr:hypothetical protein Pcinc_033282 [Petrolisthes cinctipes]